MSPFCPGSAAPKLIRQLIDSLLFGACVLICGHTTCVAEETRFAPPQGRWRTLSGDIPDDSGPPSDPRMSEVEREQIRDLEALGYLQGKRMASDLSGAANHHPELTAAGYNLVVSGHGSNAILIDMDGDTLHSWSYLFEDLWPDGIPENTPEGPGRNYWRRAYLYPNGDLLAIFEGIVMFKIDKDSRLIWKYQNRPHHDMFVLPSGRIHVLTRLAHFNPRINSVHTILEDFLVALSADGEELAFVSIFEAFSNSSFASVLDELDPKGGDIFHTNTVEILPADVPIDAQAFGPGHALISVRELNTIAVIDLEREIVTWAKTGPWRAQHHPTILDNGRILLFDNQGGRPPDVPGTSRVLEYDPVSGQIVWEYPGSNDEPFYSETVGSVQRFSNGNTLITQTDTGRAFEIDREGKIVWEYMNPERAGENKEFIATLLEVIRFPFEGKAGLGNLTARDLKFLNHEESPPAPSR